MKRISLLLISLSMFVTACNSTSSPSEKPPTEPLSLYPQSTVISEATEVFDLTGALDERLAFAGLPNSLMTPVLTAGGLNMIPSTVLANPPKTTVFSSVRFDRFDPAGDIVRTTFRFVGNNLESESIPILSLATYIKNDSDIYPQVQTQSPLVDLDVSGNVEKQIIDIVETNETLQYEVRLISGEKSTIAANVNDILMSELLVESYQTKDTDWTNANYSVGRWESCSFNESELDADLTVDSNSSSKTITNSIKLSGNEIALMTVELGPSETSFDGFTFVNTGELQGEFPFYLSLERGGDILTGINLGDCLLEAYIRNDMLENIADEDFQTELSIDFKAISELDANAQAWSQLSKPNHPISTNVGLRMYPEGYDLLTLFDEVPTVTLPEIDLLSETQMVGYHMHGFVGDLDLEACKSNYLSLTLEADSDTKNVMLFPLKAQSTYDYSLFLYVNDSSQARKIALDVDTKDCQPNAEIVYSEIYLTSIEVEQLSFDVHPLSKVWNVQLEGSGGACEGKKYDAEIALDFSSQGNSVTLGDGSQLWIQLQEPGNITWSWNVDGSNATAEDQFFYGTFIWSTMDGEQDCHKRLSLYRDRSWIE